MKITLLEDDNPTTSKQNPQQHKDLSQMTVGKKFNPKKYQFNKKDEPQAIESDWDKKILKGQPETKLDAVQDWIIEKTGNQDFKATTPYLKLLLSWFEEFGTTDPNRNPLINLFLSSISGALDNEELPNYDTLVTINNLYAGKKLTKEDLSGDKKLGIFNKGALFDKPYREQEQYIQIWKYLVSEDGFVKKLNDILEKEHKKSIEPFISSFEDKNKRLYLKDLIKYLDTIYIDKIMMKDQYQLRDLDDIRKFINEIDRTFNPSNYEEKDTDTSQVSKKDKNAIYKVIKDKNLSRDDLSILVDLPKVINEI